MPDSLIGLMCQKLYILVCLERWFLIICLAHRGSTDRVAPDLCAIAWLRIDIQFPCNHEPSKHLF